jgi:hypothetical protein
VQLISDIHQAVLCDFVVVRESKGLDERRRGGLTSPMWLNAPLNDPCKKSFTSSFEGLAQKVGRGKARQPKFEFTCLYSCREAIVRSCGFLMLRYTLYQTSLLIELG